MILLAVLVGAVAGIALRELPSENLVRATPAFTNRAAQFSQTLGPDQNSLSSGQPTINTGGAPTVSIYNGGAASAPTPTVNGASDSGKKDVVADLAQAVVKGGELNEKESDAARGASELREFELSQKSVNEADNISGEVERKAADVESSAARDAQAVDAEEKRHTTVMDVIEDEENNDNMAFAHEEHAERKKIHDDEQKLAHDEAVVEEGEHALTDENRLEADRLVTEKAKEQQNLQSTRRKYREEDEAINLGHDEVESGTMAKKLLAERTGAKKDAEEELCAEENAEQPEVPPPVGVAESMPCQASR